MKYFLCFLLWFLVASCKEKQPDPMSISDRQVALHGVGNAVIIRSLLELQNSVNALNEYARSYLSDSTDTQKLLALRREWTRTVISWKVSSLFSEGKFANETGSPRLYAPANITAIEATISSNTPRFDLAYLQTLDETSTGLSAIEYLLFGTNRGNTDSVLSAFKASGTRRGAYLRALCLDLKRRSDLLLYRWSLAGGGYLNQFMAASGPERTASTGILADNMIATISRIKEERIGAPLGLNGVAQPELVESKYGGESIAFIRAELQSVQQILTGMKTTAVGVNAFNWLLDKANAKSRDAKLSDAIEAKFAEIYRKLELVKIPLEQVIVSNPQQITDIYVSIEELQKLIEQDMVANLHFRG